MGSSHLICYPFFFVCMLYIGVYYRYISYHCILLIHNML
nr:MAG TPA: hypothetical protein [Bacteriophage sp.]